ncbi:hypothetical protein FRC05_009571 [Tulasnella sp. 425]|nr:hypothetical protein FRC05_009571 [Tulasnella sp. 425]
MAFDEPEFQHQRNLWYLGGPAPPAPSWETYLFHSRRGPEGLLVCDLYSPPFHVPVPPHLISDQPRAGSTAATPSPPPDTPPQPQSPVMPPLQAQAVQGLVENVPQLQLHQPARPQEAAPNANPLQPYNQPAVPAGNQDAQPQAVLVNGPLINIRIAIPRNGVLREVDFPSDINPDALRQRICVEADLRPDTAKLGYRLPREAKTAAPRALDTTEDFSRAIASMVGLVRRARTQVPVLIVVSLAPPPPVVQAARKGGTTPLPATPGGTAPDAILPAQQLQHLRSLKVKYACAKHSGTHRWCLVREDGDDTGGHFALTIQFLTWWAQQITEGKATLEKAPHAKQFDLKKRTRTAAEKQTSNLAMPSIIIQNQIAPAAFGDATNLPSKKRKRADSDSDSSTDSDDVSIDIGTLLTSLNGKYPALNFPQYKDQLEKKGIVYVKIATNFEEKFFKEEIGMAPGAASVFLKGCKRAMKNDKAQRATKRVARDSNSD